MKKFPVPFLIILTQLVQAQDVKKAMPVQPKPAYKTITVYNTAEKTDYRLSKTQSLNLSPFGQPLETQPCVFIDVTKTFQTITGIGGAITDASAETFARLPAAAQEELMNAYYDPEKGIGYSLLRTNMNSCDFSSDSYTYVDEKDADLKTFNIAHDEKYRLPMIKRAMAKAGKLPLYISPWSPPAWMKDNNNMLQGGKLKEEYKQSWADYFVKYIKTYESKGIPVWGLTVQNEPMAKQRWESCIYTAEEERDFIKKYLGPTLRKQGLGNKNLIAWDHNRDLLYQRATTILNDREAAKYVWGIGYHWYETWTGSAMQFENLKRVHETFPDRNLIFTEGCVEKFDMNRIHDWGIGERYGFSMVNDFNSGTVAWTDWNILLDENGGPNHVGNFCFAPVHADTRTGKLIYTNAYYYLGHFSKFVKAGARRVGTASSRDKLATTAFINPDGKLVVVVLNMSNDQLAYRIWLQGNAAEITSLPHSIATLVLE
ncbi:glycoside hydrolase family 30 protein [Longitalea luteola]|uniref:glycoside hydrolase family 30 protein n=1 Tax=Longitalea luteola TaxID=2812563 RepID=UPI001F6056B6|nr:glycoside hydrolase family 30 protein [Longitalea luteola]